MAALSNRSLQFLDQRLTFKNVPLLGLFYPLLRGDNVCYLDTKVRVWVLSEASCKQMKVQSNTGSTKGINCGIVPVSTPLSCELALWRLPSCPMCLWKLFLKHACLPLLKTHCLAAAANFSAQSTAAHFWPDLVAMPTWLTLECLWFDHRSANLNSSTNDDSGGGGCPDQTKVYWREFVGIPRSGTGNGWFSFSHPPTLSN